MAPRSRNQFKITARNRDKEEAVEWSLHNYRLFAGPLFDEEAHKSLAASNYERVGIP